MHVRMNACVHARAVESNRRFMCARVRVHTCPHTVQCDTTRCGVSGVGHVAKRPLLSL
jgi:hypothetical protein